MDIKIFVILKKINCVKRGAQDISQQKGHAYENLIS